MKFSNLTLTLFGALLSLNSAVKADFDLYSGFFNDIVSGGGGYSDTWNIFDSDPSCNDVWNTYDYSDSDDVSGDKRGVRCEDNGGGCSGNSDPRGITVVEMHFSNNPRFHWTIYKDRNFDMIGLDGKNYGHCVPSDNREYLCTVLAVTIQGRRKFRCQSQFSAAEIKAASG